MKNGQIEHDAEALMKSAKVTRATDMERDAQLPRRLSRVEALALAAAMQQLRVAQAQLHEVYDELGLDRSKQYQLQTDGMLLPIGGK